MKPRRIVKAVLNIDVGCGDNSCIWGSPGGMATNGGCRCAEKGADAKELQMDLRRAIAVIRYLTHALKETGWTIDEEDVS